MNGVKKNKQKKLAIVSVHASSVKFAAVLTAGIVLVALLVVFLPSPSIETQAGREESLDYSNVRDREDVARFLSQFGIEAEGDFFSDRTVTIPDLFGGVFAEYNELQKSQGFDLSRYAGKRLRKVIVGVALPRREQRYLATLFIYRNTVVGGDVSSEDPTGETFSFPEAGKG